MQLITVTIGRGNVAAPNFVASASRWVEFQEAIDVFVKALGYAIVGRWTGTGEWEGQVEQNYHVAGIRERLDADTEAWEREVVVPAELAHLAREYNQDAIAYGYGESVLVDKEGNAS